MNIKTTVDSRCIVSDARYAPNAETLVRVVDRNLNAMPSETWGELLRWFEELGPRASDFAARMVRDGGLTVFGETFFFDTSCPFA